MKKWYQRDYRPMLDGGNGEILEIRASIEINAPRERVWSLLKPAENAALLIPNVVRGFHIPGTPEGIGEMQGFLFLKEGKQHIAAIEVLDEVSSTYAITRLVGDTDDAARSSIFLSDVDNGTRLEQRERFTVPIDVDSARLERQYQQVLNMTVDRVKVIAEGTW